MMTASCRLGKRKDVNDVVKIAQFMVKTVRISENLDEGYRMVAFGDHLDESKIANYLTLQRAYSFDEQDVELGMDTYYLEYNGQGNSGYGVCDKIVLGRDELDFIFSKENDGEINEIKLNIEQMDCERSELEAQLIKIIGDDLIVKEG